MRGPHAALALDGTRVARLFGMEHTSMPDFELPLVGGNFLRKRDWAGKKPLVLVFWPTVGMAEVARYARKFAGEVGFCTVMESADAPDFGIPIALDAPGGRLRRTLAPKPNTAYVMDKEGWLVDEVPLVDITSLSNALYAIAPRRRRRHLFVRRALAGIGLAIAGLIVYAWVRRRA
jgi:hypothetical protein